MKMYTTEEVAKILKVAPRIVNRLFDSGRLVGYRYPETQERRVPQECLEAYIKSSGVSHAEIPPDPERWNPPLPELLYPAGNSVNDHLATAWLSVWRWCCANGIFRSEFRGKYNSLALPQLIAQWIIDLKNGDTDGVTS